MRGARVLEDLEDDPKAVGARLARVREIMRLNKKEFAEGADLTEQTYGPFENGKRPLSYGAAKKLRKAYGLSLEFMYFGKIADLPHRIAKEL